MVFKIGNDCLNCGVCLDHCTKVAIIEKDEKYYIDSESCTECGICLEVCPVQVIVEEGMEDRDRASKGCGKRVS